MSGGRDYMAIVQGLLAKAQRTEHPAEADAFLAKAQKLMADHAIDEAMVADAEGRDHGTVGSLTIVCKAPYSTAKQLLVTVIAEANHCRAIGTGTRHAETAVTVMGYEADIGHVEALYASLTIQATRAMLAQPDSSRRFRRAFLVGFANRIGARLQEAHERARTEYEATHLGGDRSVALVLADRDGGVNQAFREAFPRIRTRPTTSSSPAGIASGDRAGQRADIGNPQVGSQRALP